MRARPRTTGDTALVIAARSGDPGALEELVRSQLPLVYNLARRALSGHADVDDVVQDVMFRMVRQLPALRRPGSFRSWLTAIAVNRISTQLARGEVAAGRETSLDEAAGRPDAATEVEGATLLRVELSAQRRQVLHAGRWLSADDRAVLPLWWLQTAGELTRAEVAEALGVGVAHAGVRLQRMREHLEQSRSIVAALDAVPGCDGLDAVLAGWDGVPGPLWRKRIVRHLRSCAACAQAGEGMVATDRLLAGLALLPVPATLAARCDPAEAGAPPGISAIGRFGAAVRAHPLGVAVTAGVLAAGLAAIPAGWSMIRPAAHEVIAAPVAAPVAPAPAPARLPAGRVSLEPANAGGRFVALAGDTTALVPTSPDGAAAVRRRATVEVTSGLADPACVSVRAADGRFLRHQSWRLVPSRDERTTLFRKDATFCVRTGFTAGSVALESSNYPGWFVRHVGDELWVDQFDGSAAFRADSSFLLRPALY
ncbi:sigma-70 family RNA polymerase sigma factor [Actinoplanes sp. NPDC049599]|uniref:sigma-70 family RNA polymerase sigma factor n=1 Tax=Actinoplanes sp. NPDC049599 TaxID=3363903 RepID=UPI00379B150B